MLIKMVWFLFLWLFHQWFFECNIFDCSCIPVSDVVFSSSAEAGSISSLCISPTVFADFFYGYTGVSACSQYYGPNHMEKEQNQKKNFK
jgi:hypothetical protein